MNYYIYLLIIIAIPLISQIFVKLQYNKYSKYKNNINMNGYDIARKILDSNGLSNVSIKNSSAYLSDYYDPKNKILVLSQENSAKSSIAAASVAAHEVGHALQDKEGYFFLRLRTSIVPIVNFTSRFASIFIFIGIISELTSLLDIGIILVSLGLLFQLITLPVEFNASRRAKKELDKLSINDSGVKSVLFAAALTYVASFLVMLLEILRLILIRNSRH